MQCPVCRTPMFYDGKAYCCPCCPTMLWIREVRNETLATAQTELDPRLLPTMQDNTS